jgi:hypothetical protein
MYFNSFQQFFFRVPSIAVISKSEYIKISLRLLQGYFLSTADIVPGEGLQKYRHVRLIRHDRLPQQFHLRLRQ